MTLQLAESFTDSYIAVPNKTGGKDLIHVAAFNNLDDATFERLLDILDPFQNNPEMPTFLSEDKSKGWRARARQQRKAAKQEARAIRKQTKADASAAIKYGKAAGIQAGTVKTGGQIIGDVAGKYVDMLGNVIPAIAPALIPGAGAASGIGGILGGAAGNVIPRTGQQVDQMPDQEEEKTFLQKYGLWIGGGAVLLIGGYFLLRK